MCVRMAQARPDLHPSPSLGTQVQGAQTSPGTNKFQIPQIQVLEAQANFGKYKTFDTINLRNYPGLVEVEGQLGGRGADTLHWWGTWPGWCGAGFPSRAHWGSAGWG